MDAGYPNPLQSQCPPPPARVDGWRVFGSDFFYKLNLKRLHGTVRGVAPARDGGPQELEPLSAALRARGMARQVATPQRLWPPRRETVAWRGAAWLVGLIRNPRTGLTIDSGVVIAGEIQTG